MTQEEKARAYDEALSRAKKWYYAPNADKIPTYANRIIKEIFPELKESKDEKIRKVIRGWINTQPAFFFDNGISKEEMLAWIEKQGEQKPAIDFKAKDWYVSKVDGKIHNMTHSPNNKDEKSKWTDEDDNMLDEIVNGLIDSKYVDSVNYNIMYNWLNSIKQRMEEQ